MIQLLALAISAAVVAALLTAWPAIWGFYPLQASSWRWVWEYNVAYGTMPPFLLWSLIGGMGTVLLSVVTIQALASRARARNVHGERDNKSLHGTAHWATKADVMRAGLLGGVGAVVGGLPSIAGTKVLCHDGPEHVLAFAPTRSGKGVSLVIPGLLRWTASALVLDIKGENWRLTSGFRAAMGQRIFKFDPTAAEGSTRINPLAEIRLGTDDEIADAQNVGAMVIDPEGKGLKDFWMKSGFAWVTAAILHALYRIRAEEGRVANLADVGELLSSPGRSLEDLIKDMVVYRHLYDGKPRSAVDRLVNGTAQEMLDRAGPERSGVHSSAMTELALYRDPIVAANISESDFRLSDLMNGDAPATLYLVVPPSDIDRLRPLLRVVMNLFLRRLLQNIGADGEPTYKHRLLLMLDEFTAIGKLEIFDRSLGFMGGYGLKAFIIVQDMAQIIGTYGRENGIVGNCHIQVAFAPNDIHTAKLLSDKCGVSTQVQVHRDQSRKALSLFGSVTERVQEVSRPLLTADECMRLRGAKKTRDGRITRAGDMLIFAAGQPPILGRQVLYFQDKKLLSASRMTPVGGELATLPEDTPDAAGASIDDGEENQALPASTAPSIADRIRAAAQTHQGDS